MTEVRSLLELGYYTAWAGPRCLQGVGSRKVGKREAKRFGAASLLAASPGAEEGLAEAKALREDGEGGDVIFGNV